MSWRAVTTQKIQSLAALLFECHIWLLMMMSIHVILLLIGCCILKFCCHSYSAISFTETGSIFIVWTLVVTSQLVVHFRRWVGVWEADSNMPKCIPCIPRYNTTHKHVALIPKHNTSAFHRVLFCGNCLYRVCLILCGFVKQPPIFQRMN